MSAADYAVIERLRNERVLQIRALRPADRAAIAASLERASDETLYRRFFAPKRSFSEREIEFYLDVDFVSHVALVAALEEGGRQVIAGGARFIVFAAGRAEIAFAIDDPHQNLGIATCLMRHLVAIARASGIDEFVADVLPENAPMLKVFRRSGLPMTTRRQGGVVHVTLALTPRDPGAEELQGPAGRSSKSPQS